MSIHQMTSAELPRTQPRPPLRETDNPIQREIDAELAARWTANRRLTTNSRTRRRRSGFRLASQS